jgi:hypothetical protein
MSFETAWIVVDAWPGPLTVRIGRHNPSLDRLLARHGAASCAYLPGVLPPPLAVDLEATYGARRFDAHAVFDDAYAPIQHGELWLAIPRQLAASYAVKLFRRDTLVWHEPGRPTQVLYGRGRRRDEGALYEYRQAGDAGA